MFYCSYHIKKKSPVQIRYIHTIVSGFCAALFFQMFVLCVCVCNTFVCYAHTHIHQFTSNNLCLFTHLKVENRIKIKINICLVDVRSKVIVCEEKASEWERNMDLGLNCMGTYMVLKSIRYKLFHRHTYINWYFWWTQAYLPLRKFISIRHKLWSNHNFAFECIVLCNWWWFTDFVFHTIERNTCNALKCLILRERMRGREMR